MTRVAILSAGVVSSGGGSLDETFNSLIEQRDTRRKFRETEYMAHMVPMSMNLPHLPPGRYLFELAKVALMQAMGGPIASPYPEILVLGSTTDTFAELEQGMPLVPSLGNHLASLAGIDRVIQFSNACASSSTAIATAADLIKTGKAKCVLVGGADEVLRCVLDAFHAARIYGNQCRPFDKNRHGLVLGEAAAFFVMSADDEIHSEPIAYLDGAGLTCDAMDAAAMSPDGIAKAIRRALSEAQLERVHFVVAHGTGTKENDAAEAKALHYVWPDGPMPFVVSYKGGLGHPQGTSGALGLALAIEALRSEWVFPTVGLEAFDPDLNIPTPSEPLKYLGMDSALVLSHGTWGVDSALVVRKS